MRKKPILPAGLLRRLEAGVVGAAVLWAAAVTAGSDTAAAALSALREALPMGALRWELGDLWPQDQLSPAAVLAISQAPLLLSARAEVAELWQSAETAPPAAADEETEEAAPTPVEETPLDVPSPAAAEDNGVPARTLVPNDPSGYTVFGRCYISNSTDYEIPLTALGEPFAATLTDEEPQILIIHTHGSEAYTPAPGTEVVWSGDYRTTDTRYNVVKVGDEMAAVFGEAGISVLHDRTLYDYPSYSGAYDRSLSAIQSYLAQYPSIRFILDVHRDAIEDGQGNQYKVVSPVEGLGTSAQMTLVVGSDGSGLMHPDWMENLRLAVALQQDILAEYPTLMRPLLLRNSRYNQHATTGSLLVEVGAAGNAPEEAALAGRILAQRITEVLRAQSK
ncbi:stage II sporulation protein P [Oscillibacter sp. 1-3]|uniref:stage II sporulation protein P n=1 Tax=Oscillibacter sp. 1-3 TaxID=1235797 RepID=UPI00033EDB05|nr:stage II sporulation protein P [Oscillibacter sp. 1-3]EOS65408.1 stage II sporulation protein P [Oscillibacter sp. 1-3]MCI9511402.1 stage II sporulation protein P [Oscillibacter sp.]